MRMKPIHGVCLALCLCVISSVFGQSGSSDPLSGTWTGDWGPSPTHRNPVTVELKWDGKALTGTVNPGANSVALQKATFDPKTGDVHFEADAKGRRGNDVHYVIDGKVDKDAMSGSWSHDNRNGDFKITRKQ